MEVSSSANANAMHIQSVGNVSVNLPGSLPGSTLVQEGNVKNIIIKNKIIIINTTHKTQSKS